MKETRAVERNQTLVAPIEDDQHKYINKKPSDLEELKKKFNIKNKKWQNDFSMIDEQLDNGVSDFYSKAYLRHLFIAQEILALQIASIHNLSFYLWLVKEARKQIIAGTFLKWKNKMVKQLAYRL